MVRLKRVFCKTCGKEFFRENGRYNEAKKFGWNQYCSKECLYREMDKTQMLLCENCGKSIFRSPNAISLHNYCSRSCAAIVNNRNDPKRVAKFKVCLKCGANFSSSKGNLKFCSMDCRDGARTKYGSEDLLQIIKDKFKELTRVPARREVKISKQCMQIFGSWNNAIIAAGFSPHRSDSQRMYKRTNTKALDGHLCDSVSEALIDNWFFSHKIPHQRDVYYPTTNHRADWAVEMNGQRIFIEYFGLANDSKRYDRDINYKRELCQANGVPLIEIYPKDLYPKNCLNEKLYFFILKDIQDAGDRTQAPFSRRMDTTAILHPV